MDFKIYRKSIAHPSGFILRVFHLRVLYNRYMNGQSELLYSLFKGFYPALLEPMYCILVINDHTCR
jgi:hypothetical protein